ncbi:hypothetical protein CANINC_004769 [Pichia inconspicua]|uniref:VPS37 C-terminal domain-containing protein n=1 Tax=Pichia inconspicua TaxID=52247 RepID=A0A4T0WV86_9ASCO|nr:hypothetical protein CANINC_004769 [[Candida] inconspicua]
MDQPPLPKPPTQQQEQTHSQSPLQSQPERQPYKPIPFRAPPPLPQTKNNSPPIDYPFTIIDSEYAVKLFGRQIEIPGYVEWISNSKLREFVDSKVLQEGYIKKTYQQDIERIENELQKIRIEHRKAAEDMLTQYTELAEKLNVAEGNLTDYYKLLSQFEEQKIQMYDSFRYLTRQAVAERYKKRLLEIEKKTEELVDCDNVDNLEKLLSEYKDNRFKWHETKCIINDLETNKILN